MSVEGLTHQFRVAEFGEDLPQTLPAVHQAVKELRKELKDLKQQCNSNHLSLSARMSSFQVMPASSSKRDTEEERNTVLEEMRQPYRTPKVTRVDSQGNPYLPETDDEDDDTREKLGLHSLVNKDTTYVVLVKVKIGSSIRRWKALMDTGSRLNVVNQYIIPVHLRQPTTCERIVSAGGDVQVQHQTVVDVILDQKTMVNLVCPLVTGIDCAMYLGTPFFKQFDVHGAKTHPRTGQYGYFVQLRNKEWFFPFVPLSTPNVNRRLERMENSLCKLEMHKEVLRIQDHLNRGIFSKEIREITDQFKEFCSDEPNKFWHKKKHEVSLPLKEGFQKKLRRSKAIPMNEEQLKWCKEEIKDLLQKGRIRKSTSSIACYAFYVNKNAEKARGKPRLVVNYKPLNAILDYDAYPLPKPSILLAQISKSKIYSEFDLKSGFWQVGITETDKWKTAFSVPQGHYEWNIMPFGLMNAPSAFQRIMDETFTDMDAFCKKYIDDILIHSNSIQEHLKHLKIFMKKV